MMFDTAYIRNPKDYNGELDLGSVLETLLYYKSVHWIIDSDTVQKLISKIGFKGFIEILKMEHLFVTFVEEFNGIRTETTNGFQVHSAIIGSLKRRADGRKVRRGETIEESIQRAKGKKLSRKEQGFIDKHSYIQSTSQLTGEAPMSPSSIVELVNNRTVFQEIVRHVCNTNNLPQAHGFSKFAYELSLYDEQIIVGSDPVELILPSNESKTVGWANILASAFDYYLDTRIASHLSVDLFGSDMSAAITSLYINEALARGANAKEKRERFETYVFDEAGAFSEAYNSGHLGFSKALDAVKRSRDMRDWLVRIPPSADLVKEYIYSVDRSLEGNGLGRKALKIGLFGVDATGMLGTGLMGSALGSVAEMIGDMILIDGWRPSVFVNRISRITR